MHLTLADVLRHPTLTAADPQVVAGSQALGRRVRWVHSSEVLDIAPLLRGGELLLTGGEMLGTASEARQRRYVRDLARHGVAGVAVETGPELPTLPPSMLAEAEARGFPVIELRLVVPFVSVMEAVNGELVNESVTLLRHGGEISHALSSVLSSGAGLAELLDELVRRTDAPAAVFDNNGELLARSGVNGSDGDQAGAAALTSRVAVRGVHAATLALYPDRHTDMDLLRVAVDPAVEALGLALLRDRPPSTRELAGSQLAQLAARGSEHLDRLRDFAQVLEMPVNRPVVAIAVRTLGRAATAGLDTLLRTYGRAAIDVSDGDQRCVVSFKERRGAALARARLLKEVSAWAANRDDVAIVVGPVVPSLDEVAVSMRAAVYSLEHTSVRYAVVDATAVGLEHWLVNDDMRAQTEEFVVGQLGMLLDLGENEREQLMQTLEVYLDSGCHKTRTAELLHLRRQSLYARLERCFAVVGGDPTGSPRALSLHLALRLRRTLPTRRAPRLSGPVPRRAGN